MCLLGMCEPVKAPKYNNTHLWHIRKHVAIDQKPAADIYHCLKNALRPDRPFTVITYTHAYI